jgi:hypothetical protein
MIMYEILFIIHLLLRHKVSGGREPQVVKTGKVCFLNLVPELMLSFEGC